MNELDITKHVIGVVFTQYLLCASLTKFKQNGKEAIQQELKQLHNMDVLIPIPADNLTPEQTKNALLTVTFIKEKHDARVKGRVCANGCKQREDVDRNEAASPTVTNEFVFSKRSD